MLNKIVNIKNIFILLISFSLVACTTVTRQNTTWEYAKDAITLDIKADRDLNMYDDESHTLAMAIIQVSSPKKYTKLLQTTEGLSEAIANDTKFDDLTGFDRIYVSPAEETTVSLDRHKDTKYVFIVFGYADVTDVSKNSYMLDIPFDEGWWGDGPLNLDLDICLGAKSINDLEAK